LDKGIWSTNLLLLVCQELRCFLERLLLQELFESFKLFRVRCDYESMPFLLIILQNQSMHIDDSDFALTLN